MLDYFFHVLVHLVRNLKYLMERSLNLLDYFTCQSGEEPIKNVWKGGGPLKKTQNKPISQDWGKKSFQYCSLVFL